MLEINMPKETIGVLVYDGEIARGPFVAVHNGTPTLGGFMVRADGDAISFYSGGRGHRIDAENYQIIEQDDVISAVCPRWRSSWFFRALDVADKEWLVPTDEERDSIQTIEQLTLWADDALSGV